MNIKNNRGFSLVEVLVTVGLVGILVGIAVPSYNKYKKSTLSMAIKADVANGHKAYSAYNATDGDFCTTLSDAGINVDMTSGTYRSEGFFGFATINVNCDGDPSDVNTVQELSTGYCQDNMTKAKTTDDKTACDTATTKTWQAVNQGSKPTTGCDLAADAFQLGAYTGTADVDTMFTVDQDGKVGQGTSQTNCN